MSKPEWCVATFLAIVFPLAGGIIGCFVRIQDLSENNLSWIVIWSLPFVALGLVGTGIVAVINSHKKMEKIGSIGLLAAGNILNFMMAAWFLDSVSGV